MDEQPILGIRGGMTEAKRQFGDELIGILTQYHIPHGRYEAAISLLVSNINASGGRLDQGVTSLQPNPQVKQEFLQEMGIILGGFYMSTDRLESLREAGCIPRPVAYWEDNLLVKEEVRNTEALLDNMFDALRRFGDQQEILRARIEDLVKQGLGIVLRASYKMDDFGATQETKTKNVCYAGYHGILKKAPSPEEALMKLPDHISAPEARILRAQLEQALRIWKRKTAQAEANGKTSKVDRYNRIVRNAEAFWIKLSWKYPPTVEQNFPENTFAGRAVVLAFSRVVVKLARKIERMIPGEH